MLLLANEEYCDANRHQEDKSHFDGIDYDTLEIILDAIAFSYERVTVGRGRQGQNEETLDEGTEYARPHKLGFDFCNQVLDGFEFSKGPFEDQKNDDENNAGDKRT